MMDGIPEKARYPSFETLPEEVLWEDRYPHCNGLLRFYRRSSLPMPSNAIAMHASSVR